MPGNALPLWVQYVQALGFPIVGSLIALVGAWIAWQQMGLARVKLQHDLHERRLAIFSAARDLLSTVVVSGTPTAQDIGGFTVKTVGAAFDYNQSIVEYLNMIASLASALLVDEQTLAGLPDGDATLSERIGTNRRWLNEQIQQRRLTERFFPYLAIDPATRL